MDIEVTSGTGTSKATKEQGNEGFNMLARTLQKRMQTVGESPLILDFGTINGDFSLKTNTFPLPIPVSDYQVCRTLTYGHVSTQLTIVKPDTGQHPHGPTKDDPAAKSGMHLGHSPADPKEGEHQHPPTEGGHNHPVLIPEKMRSLKPGDRVLVAWIGNDAVVIDLILPATAAM